MRADVPAGEAGWHRTADLLDHPQRLRALVDEAVQALARDHPRSTAGVRSTVAAAVLLSDWCWALAAVGAGALTADRRVPSLEPRAVWLQVHDGRVAGVAVTSGEARPLGCQDLDAVLRRELTSHLTRLHEALRSGAPPLLRRGPRAMWGAAGDGVATALRLQAENVGQPAELLAAAERLLAGAPASWGRHGFDRLGADGVTRTRTSCCLWYRLPDAPACATCPRTRGRAPVAAT